MEMQCKIHKAGFLKFMLYLGKEKSIYVNSMCDKFYIKKGIILFLN